MDVAKFLFDRGADPAEPGPTGTTALEEARENEQTEICEWLEEILRET